MMTEIAKRPLSQVVSQMRRSGIREIMDLSQGLPDVVHLEVGEPGFPTPAHIVDAAYAAAQAGFTKYTPNAGLLSLRQALVQKLKRVNRLETTVDNIVVTPGAVTGIATALEAILEPGEEVLLPDPGWPNYLMMVQCARAIPVFYPLSAERGFTPDFAVLAELVTPRTKVLMVNSPANPSGAVFAKEIVRQLVDFAREYNLYLIADEVYEQIIFEGQHLSAGEFDTDGRVVCVSGFSKTYAMTGWRVGYVVAPTPIAGLVAKLQEPYVSCASAVSQKAAEAALLGPQDCVQEMCQEYQRHRDLAVQMLGSLQIPFFKPQGTFYLLVDISAYGLDSYTLAKRLVREVRVAVAPGDTFGPGGKNYVRISLAPTAEAIQEGLARFGRFMTT